MIVKATAAHPDDCLCDVCSPERVLSESGGFEWVDDGRAEVRKMLLPEYGLLDLAVFVLTVVIGAAVLFGG